MFLKRAILINWGNIPQIELEFGPVNLFSGGNGSGKTTAADAIQALMTAAHENLFAFNPGQDETTQKGRGGKQVRTLASYLLGCDDGSYARTDTHDAYVAGVFCPTEGEDCDPFTAVMAMRGHLEKSGPVKQARLDELFFLLVPFEQLQLNHFVQQDKGGKYLLPLERLAPNLKKQFGAGAVEIYDKKGAYLRRLYGALRGRKDSVSDREARHAARTFSGFMAYKPVKSIHDFVAGEILEPRDLGEAIRSVSDLMKTIHDMEAKAVAIKESAQLLERAREITQAYNSGWTSRVVTHYTASSAKFHQNQQAYLKSKQEQKNQQQKIHELEGQIEQVDQQRQQLHHTIVNLEAKRQGISALRDKDSLQEDISRQQKKLNEFARPVVMQLQQLQQNLEAAADLLQQIQRTSLAVEIPVLEQKDFVQLTREVSQNAGARELEARQLLNQDWIDPSALQEKIAAIMGWQNQQNRWLDYFNAGENTADTLRERIYTLVVRRNEIRQRLNQEVKEKIREIQLLRDQQVRYPSFVEQAIKILREQCPAADAKVLCDFVEVKDARWQMAVEGYMGGARFGIMVEPAWEAEAIRVVRNMRCERNNKARIIQGAKAARDAERSHCPPESIVTLMDFSHSTAADYLKASYGSVVQVPDAEILKTTARGLTADGMASGNYAMWRCDLGEGELVFGKTARARALKAKELELEHLSQNSQNAEQAYQQALRLQEICQRIKPVHLHQLLQDMVHIQGQLLQAEQALMNLDLKDVEYLECELQDKRRDYLLQEQRGKQFEQTLGGLLQQQKHIDLVIKQLADMQERLTAEKDQAEQSVLAIQQVLPRFDPEVVMLDAERVATESTQEEYSALIQSQTDRLNSLERDLFKIVQLHNQSAATADQLIHDTAFSELHSPAFFKHWVNLAGTIDSLHNRLKNNILVERHRQLRQLKDSFNTAFVTNLCHSIYQAINEGKNILEDLNRELSHHCFGSDQERFYFAMSWVPEYQEYWQFFKTIISTPNLGDGATLFELELPPKQAATRDRLLSMLLDEDQHTAYRELARISDYRNYRRYEIYKQPKDKEPIALSQYGTGSGGQLETPAYIIRAAAVTSAFRFNEGKSHLRMVMVDEAFSKMDETRSREVIRYLTESLGLQLIFIMPTSKSGPFLDMISNQLVFSKCPTQQPVGELKTRVLVDRKVCRQEQIARLWANHRKTIRHQAMLDFMEEFRETDIS